MTTTDVKRIDGCLLGPYTDEADFKSAFLSRARCIHTGFVLYEIENEKEEGMPDILAMSYDRPAVLIELKYIRSDGRAKFRPMQPLWYKRNKSVRIKIIAWDSRVDIPVHIPVHYVLDVKKRSVQIPICLQKDGIKFTKEWLYDC